MKENNFCDNEYNLSAKIAWLYYIENLTQKKIAEKLDISRMKVIRLLDKAKNDNLVQISLRQDNNQRIEKEKRLINIFSLNDVYIVPTNCDVNINTLNIAKAAAMYMCHRLSENHLINIGYGKTVSLLINELASLADFPISMVSLTGGVNQFLSNLVGGLNNTKLHLIPAPLIASSPEMAKAFMSEPSVKEIMHMTHLATMTVVGIGGMDDEATIFRSDIISKNEKKMLSLQGATGDILSHFYNREGELVSPQIDDRLVACPLHQLEKLPNVIGIAGGPAKSKAIYAACKNSLLDVLVTDENTADNLIERYDNEREIKK